MNQAVIKSNEFIIRVEEDDAGQIHFKLRNPHTEVGMDGQFNDNAFMALNALLHFASKIKRKIKPPDDDESDPELYG